MRLNREGEKSLKRGLFAPTNERIFRESVSRRCESYCRENLGQLSSIFFQTEPVLQHSPRAKGFRILNSTTWKVKKMSHPLKQKVALVTGGSRGIGAAIAKRLAADGASLAITYSKGADAATSVVSAIEQAGGKAIAIQADAADAEAVKDAVEKTVAVFGGIDVLVNNAGTAIPKKFEETTLEEIDRMFAINVRGTMAATQAALKHMKSGGRIIMIGSCVGERTLTPGLVAYSATKGAVKMFTQGLTREVGGRGITVNNVQPGPIDTDLNPAAGDWAVPQKAVTALDRFGHVDEVAALVAFVAGPESSYITGANLTVDGGTNA
jgi:3-oxoacyl-[acyl-carrier protein] reductase